MANRLVDHLRKGVAGEGTFARLVALASAEGRRSMMARLRGRWLARLFLGTTLAFACGVGLGVGVATVIAPEAAVIRDMIMNRPGTGAQAHGGQGTADAPVIAVRVRKEGGTQAPPLAETAGPPLAVFTPAERKPAAVPPVASAPAQSEPATATVAPASPVEAEPVTPETATAALIAPGPAIPEPAAPAETTAREAGPAPAEPFAPAQVETHVNVPIGDIAPFRKDAPVEPGLAAMAPPKDDANDAAAAPAPDETRAPATKDPAVAAAAADPSRPADAPVAMAPPGQPASPLAQEAPAAAAAPVPHYQYEEKTPPVPLSDLQVALGPAGLDGLASSSAPRNKAADDLSDVTPPPHPAAKNLQLAALPMPRADAWIRNALKMPEKRRDVVIAMIIDDMGIDQKRSWAMIALPGPLTLSFIPYGYHLRALTRAGHKAGHEIMLHEPMEPVDPETNPGPHALLTTLSVEENRQRLLWALSRVDGIVGINNHMGSKFTAWPAGMEMVMQEVKRRGLLFVDSFTSSESVGFKLARADGLPSAARDVFLDHDLNSAAIWHRLEDLERIARRRGFAVGIGHPHDLTREALKKWMVEARARGIDFVPISYIIRKHMNLVSGRG